MDECSGNSRREPAQMHRWPRMKSMGSNTSQFFPPATHFSCPRVAIISGHSKSGAKFLHCQSRWSHRPSSRRRGNAVVDEVANEDVLSLTLVHNIFRLCHKCLLVCGGLQRHKLERRRTRFIAASNPG